MRKFIILLTLLIVSTNIWAHGQEYKLRRIEVEPSFGMGRGVAIALEVRNNISAYWDIGLHANMSNVGYTSDIVSDYNFARPNKQLLFFVGAGLGLGTYDESDYTDGPSGTSTGFHFMPRAGIELFQHLRLTLNVNTYNFSSVYPILSLGIVFGGGRK